MVLIKEISNALSYATSRGFRIHPDAFAMLKGLDRDLLQLMQNIIKSKSKDKNLIIVVEDIKNIINSVPVSNTDSNSSTDDVNLFNSNSSSYTTSTVSASTSQNSTGAGYDYYQKQSGLEFAGLKRFETNSVALDQIPYKINLDPTDNVATAEGIEGYISLFKSRYEKSLRILALRPESKKIISVAMAKHRSGSGSGNKNFKNNKEENSESGANSMVIAGLLMSKRNKKNGYEIAIDDTTGIFSAVAVNEDLKNQASMLALDQMVMIEVENSRRGMQGFTVKNIVSPDIPDHIPNKARSESFAVLISDMHVGSKYFMEKEFVQFLNWLGSDDDVVKKIKYVCIAGDLIDGIGIFPNQDKELVELNVGMQMAHVASLLAKIPKHIKVFVIPGNHDPGRRALPQPSLEFDKEILVRSGFFDINTARNVSSSDLDIEIERHNPSPATALQLSSNSFPGKTVDLFGKITDLEKNKEKNQNENQNEKAEQMALLPSFENFTMIGNPGYIELDGVKVLMFHGQSLDDIIATTPGLSYAKPAEAMKVLLKARHLSPIYGQRTPIAPETEDMMVISEVPDILHSGHVHVLDVQNYKGTLMVNSGAWQAQTKFQQTMGITPTPGIAILVNLATMRPFQMDFNIYGREVDNQ